MNHFQKDTLAYMLLTSLVICGLAGSLITAPKIVQFGMNFPFSNLVFSVFTYPIIDCICELWGKQAAKYTLWMSLLCQLLLAVIIQLSIYAPSPSFWTLQNEYEMVLSSGFKVVLASLLAFALSQLLDLVVYQKIKERCRGKHLWLRSNFSTYIGQALDSIIFVNIVFFNSSQKFAILSGSILIKIFLSLLMTPVIYLIVSLVNRYLNFQTQAFTAGYPVTCYKSQVISESSVL